MRTRAIAALVLAALGAPACVVLGCTPVTIVVAGKEERTRVERELRGISPDRLGRIGERHLETLVHEFWVRDRDGRWYRVPEADWRRAREGEPLEVCR